ncbi:uncharacterized protein LODBEIA_P26880 [Lodderomyces beijingensis]|uniref:Glutamyl-tRNA(Gln) amidotransferase subunit B, mitochondrial n=1 Tax=Lodderomyces beijingensis TaxID=1775926 RepID=A0ABP0ZKQ7_9ASCO
MLRRTLATAMRNGFKFHPDYKFKCGLEIHTQLKTKYKLFSLSKTSFNAPCNTEISYLDVGLPGSQPTLNPEALYLALRAAVALNCKVQPVSRFDRKHYFYPDQPLGYQITQNFHPLAKDGYLELSELDSATGKIRIEKIQLEQDTGKKHGDIIDYNRADTPLIEVVTKPDFETIEQVLAFVKKYQLLVRHFDICSGDLETGAIRVDVNVNVNSSPRVEIKNLSTTGDILDALKYEYNRQVGVLQSGGELEQQTRSWDGFATHLSRSKENAVDYRYVPDSELPKIYLAEDIAQEIASIMPQGPDEVLNKLTQKPHSLQLAHARNLLIEPQMLKYYESFFDSYSQADAKKWMFQELLAGFSKEAKEFDPEVVKPEALAELANSDLSHVSKRLALRHMIQHGVSFDKAQAHLNLSNSSDVDAVPVDELCAQIIEANHEVVERIQAGHKNAIEVLVGKAMKSTRGQVQASIFREKFIELLL